MRVGYLVSCWALCAILSCMACAQDEVSSGVLHWNNGDMLSGNLVGYDEDYVRWKSEQFDSPLEVHADFISTLTFAVPARDKAKTHAEAFRVEAISGDVLFGDLVSIDEQTVVLDGNRVGRVELRREFVREIRQLKHTQVLYDGPRWLDGWKVLKAGRMVSEWEATENGFLRTEKYGGELFHDLPELDVAEINLVLRWSGKPGFQLDFASPSELVATRPRPRLSIKSWGDDVVAQSSLAATDFQHLLKLSERQTELRIRLVWDNKAGEILISGEGGRRLGRVVVAKGQKERGFGVLVKNRSDDLTLEQIRVSKWNGASKSEDREEGKSYIRLASGQLIDWTSLSLNQGAKQLDLANSVTVPLADMAIAEFIPTGRVEVQMHHLRFFDGTEFSGKVDSISADLITVRIPSVTKAINVKRDGIESIRCFQGRTNEFDFHLVGAENRLSGNLRPVSVSHSLGWAPIGSRYPVPVRVGTDQTIERRMGGDAAALIHTGSEVVYLRDDSVLIGDVKSVDTENLVFVTPYTAEQAIPIPKIRATEMLKGSGRVSFSDSSWEFMRESRPVQRAHEFLEVSESISMRDLNLFHNGKLSFGCAWDEDFVGLLTIHLGTSSTQPRNSIARFTFSRDRVSARCLVDSVASNSLPVFSDRRATISMEAKDDQLTVWVNGILAFKAKTRKKIENKGLWLQCGSARGPLSNSSVKRAPVLMIERLRVGDHASRLGAGFASSNDLQMMLKLPRNRVDDAPGSVICSSNGDLLRGDLIGMDDEDVRFKSRYEEVIMPRSEVNAIVWLSDAVSAESHYAENSLRMTLRDGSVFHLRSPMIVDEYIVGEHDLLKTCKVPLQQVLKIQNGNVEWQSIARTIDWKLEPTPEPRFVDGEGEQGLGSPLVGLDVADVTIPMMKGEDFRLGDQQDKIIVLDFWASWCAPCVSSLPKMINLAATFPEDRVRFVAVNQEEGLFKINEFLANRNLVMAVGLDPDLALSRKFRVATLPQTVIIGGTGKVERVFIGAPSDLHKTIAQAINDLLPPTD